MKQLTGLDATWLNIETPASPLHIGVANVFDYPEDPDFSPLEATRAQFASRVPLIEPLRRRLVEVPFGLGRPYWVMDPEFDLDAHIHHHVAASSDDDAVAELIGEIMTPPLDRSRPLWEAHVVEGLADGRWAIVTKYHHATIDGGAGILLIHLLLDADPDTRPEVPATLVPDAEPVPSDRELLAKATASIAGNPRKFVKLQVNVARTLATQARSTGLGQVVRSAGNAVQSVVRRDAPDQLASASNRLAPRTPWNTSIGIERKFAFASLPIADIMALKSACGGTVNDVVMSVCAGGLRRYLQAKDALPNRPLIAMVPVSKRTGAEAEPWRNLISVIRPMLPTHEPNVSKRFASMQESMSYAKAQLDFVPDEVLQDAADLAPGAMMSAASQLAARLRVSDRIESVANLSISNVAGPRAPLFLGGARLTNLTPLSLLTEGIGLNITVLSCGDRLDFGLAACAKSIPDLSFMLECLLDELDELHELAGTESSETRSSHRAAEKKTKR